MPVHGQGSPCPSLLGPIAPGTVNRPECANRRMRFASTNAAPFTSHLFGKFLQRNTREEGGRAKLKTQLQILTDQFHQFAALECNLDPNNIPFSAASFGSAVIGLKYLVKAVLCLPVLYL
jgi:hypothetical protein